MKNKYSLALFFILMTSINIIIKTSISKILHKKIEKPTFKQQKLKFQTIRIKKSKGRTQRFKVNEIINTKNVKKKTRVVKTRKPKIFQNKLKTTRTIEKLDSQNLSSTRFIEPYIFNGIANSTNTNYKQSGIVFQLKTNIDVVLRRLSITTAFEKNRRIRVYYINIPIFRLFERMNKPLTITEWTSIYDSNYDLKKYEYNNILTTFLEFSQGTTLTFLITEFDSNDKFDNEAGDSRAYITANFRKVTKNYEVDFNSRGPLSNSILDISDVVFINKDSLLGTGPDYVLNDFSGIFEFKRMIKVSEVYADGIFKVEEEEVGTNRAQEMIDSSNYNNNKGYVVTREGHITFKLTFEAEFRQILLQGVNRKNVSVEEGSYAEILISSNNNNYEKIGELPKLTSSVQYFELQKKVKALYVKITYKNAENGKDYRKLGLSYFRPVTHVE